MAGLSHGKSCLTTDFANRAFSFLFDPRSDPSALTSTSAESARNPSRTANRALLPLHTMVVSTSVDPATGLVMRFGAVRLIATNDASANATGFPVSVLNVVEMANIPYDEAMDIVRKRDAGELPTGTRVARLNCCLYEREFAVPWVCAVVALTVILAR